MQRIHFLASRARRGLIVNGRVGAVPDLPRVVETSRSPKLLRPQGQLGT